MTSPLQSRRVFVDTGAFFALYDTSQVDHRSAVLIQRRLGRERWQLITTNLVVAETHALALRRLGRSQAARLLNEIDDSATVGGLIYVRVQSEDEARARQIIRQYDDKDFSLTDATSFAVVERLRIPYAFTFDRNFTQFGLDVLSPRS
jgi:uncharacterized protein